MTAEQHEFLVEPITVSLFSDLQAWHQRSLPAWEADEPVQPLHRAVARLQPAPAMPSWVEEDVLALGMACRAEADPGVGYEFELDSIGDNDQDPPPISARLGGFLRAAMARFDNVVATDLGVTEEDLRLYSLNVTVGPFTANPENSRWHRDYVEDPGAITYLLPLLGAPTIYSQDATRNSDFTSEDGSPDPEGKGQYLFPPHIPRNQRSYGTGIVTAHDSTFTAHRAPTLDVEGRPRILLSYIIDEVL